jgi:dihydroorotase
MNQILLHNATIVNQGEEFIGSILIQQNIIADVFRTQVPESLLQKNIRVIDCTGKVIIPGVIDDQVHFREPGLIHKGTIATESKAAIAGGVTSFMEMPNVNPQTTTIQNLEQKFDIASQSSFANYSFYLGATNDNIDQLRALDKSITCGVKVFMGSSTGNMLVDNPETLQKIFTDVRIPIATHCEDEATIQAILAHYKLQYGEDIPIALHPTIRSAEACFKS